MGFASGFQTGQAIGKTRQQKQLGQLGQQYLGGDESVFPKIAGRDPERARNLQIVQSEQQKQQQLELQKGSMLAQTVLDADPEDRPEVYRATMAVAKQYGIDTTGLDDIWSDETEGYLQNVVNVASGMKERKGAVSPVGKIQEDITAKRLTPDIGKRALEKAVTSTPQTQITFGAEKEEQKGLGKYRAKQYEDVQDLALVADTQNQMYDVMEQAFSDPNVYTGTGAGFVKETKKAAASLGFKLRGITNTAKIDSFSNQLALKARGKDMPGTMSEKDREFLKDIVPGLKKTREGNLGLIRINKKLNQRKIDIARLQENYLTENGTLKGFAKAKREFVKNNPLFKEEDRATIKAPPSSVNNDPAGIR